MIKIIIFCFTFITLVTGHCYADIASYCTGTQYRSYDKILTRLDELKESSIIPASLDFYATIMSAGTTTTGRPIQGIVITSPTSTGAKANVLITGAIHANEWIGTEVAIGLAEYLIANRTNTTPVDLYPFGSSAVADPKNMNIKALLENVKVIIIPVLNPDGYVYSMTNYDETCISSNPTPSCYFDVQTEELYSSWRKNRRDLSTIVPGAYGVDINRNFDMNYQSSPPNEVDDNEYAGNAAMSEKENLAVDNLFNSYETS